MVGREPPAHRPPGQRQIGAAARALASVGSSAAARASSRSLLVAGQVGLAGEQGHRVAAGQVGQQGQQFVAHPVAQVARVGVGRVVHDRQCERAAQGHGLGPAQGEQGRAAGAHRRQAGQRGAAQQVEQHGLGLVVGGVAGEHARGQHAVAGLAGAGLQVGPVGDGHRLGAERAPEECGVGRDHLGLVGENRRAGRGRRGWPSPPARRRRPGPAARWSRRHRTRHRRRRARRGNVQRANNDACRCAARVAGVTGQSSRRWRRRPGYCGATTFFR